MTENQVTDYVKNHGHLVGNAIRSIKTRLTREESEDMSQELYITMLHCLKNYNPAFKTPMDVYVSASLYKRVLGLQKELFSGARGREYRAQSIHDAKRGEDKVLVDTLMDERRGFVEYIEAGMISDEFMAGLDPLTREIVDLWAQGISAACISRSVGISPQAVWYRIGVAIDKLRDMVGGGNERN